MKVKTYKTQSLQEGLEDIKRDLGSEALILSTRSVPARAPFNLFRKPSWEITAALEEKTVNIPEPSPSATPTNGRGFSLVEDSPLPLKEVAAREARTRQSEALTTNRVRVSTSTTGAAAAVAPARIVDKDPRMDQLIEEITDLKSSFRSLSKAIPAQSHFGGLFAELVRQGIDHDLADHLITTASRGNPAPSELRGRVRRLLG